MKELEGSLLLCRKLKQEEDPLKADPEEYLRFIREEEQEGRKFSPAEEMLGQISDFTAECYGGSGWFLVYNLSFLKYWSNKRKTAE